MKKYIISVASTLTSLSLLVVPAFAQCAVNGAEVPCDIFWAQYGWIFMLAGVFFLATSIFWLVMFIDCIKRDFKDKTLWLILLVVTNLFGAVLYFFMVKRKQKTSMPTQTTPVMPTEPTMPATPITPTAL